MDSVITAIGNSIYFAQAVVAAWGAYCLVLVWLRIGQRSFQKGKEQDEFLTRVDERLRVGEGHELAAELSGDPRALSQLVLLGVQNRSQGLARVRQLMVDRFQQDFLTDLEHRLTWVNTAIKTEPMLGLHGTVLGMIGAFGKLATAENVKPEGLAQDISLALITTAVGLTIAIPLIIAVSGLTIRIAKMEDGISNGLSRFFDIFQATESIPDRLPVRRGAGLP